MQRIIKIHMGLRDAARQQHPRARPIEVADTLGISVRQVERTVTAFMSGLRRSLAQPASRTRSRSLARLRRAA